MFCDGLLIMVTNYRKLLILRYAGMAATPNSEA